MFLSFQDFEKAINKGEFIKELITYHRGTASYRTAQEADLYDIQENPTIKSLVRIYYNYRGEKMIDKDSTNIKIPNNYFHRLNTQRCSYSLTNGVTFENTKTKDRLGEDFDEKIMEAAYYGLIHKVSFIFVNVDHLHVFPMTQFAPLWDEDNGSLRAGVRFWQIDPDKPVVAVLYEEDGYTKYKSESLTSEFVITQEKRSYRKRIQKGKDYEENEIVGEEHGVMLPIVPIYGSKKKVSTLNGMRPRIDAIDLIASGFANTVNECAEIYWLISNADAMTDEDLKEYMERLQKTHIANADEAQVTPYTQDIPYQARQAVLADLRNGLYEDFGALDVHTVSAGATNDHIDAAYQPVDDEAGPFEAEVTKAIKMILKIIGVEDKPTYKRNKISNQSEAVNMVIAEAEYLDDETVLKKLPNIEPEEVQDILRKKQKENLDRFAGMLDEQEETEEGDEDVQE